MLSYMDWLLAKVFGETLPSDELINWLFSTYEWLFRYRGGYDGFLRSRKLILPLNENFTITATSNDGIAQEVLEHVKWYARMDDWNCRLEAHDDIAMTERMQEREDDADSRFGIRTTAGTFSMDWNHSDATITYSPGQLQDLASLVATFAHELSHFYLATIPFEPPAGPSAEEHATDVCAVAMGFGIFLANTAQKYANGAVVSRKGYLGEVALSYALAIFSELKGVNEKDLRKHLKSNPRSYVGSALRDLRRRWPKKLEALRQVKPQDA